MAALLRKPIRPCTAFAFRTLPSHHPLSDVATARRALLQKIYAPAAHLPPNSESYNALAESGKCWHDYFDPGNAERYGFTALERVSHALHTEGRLCSTEELCTDKPEGELQRAQGDRLPPLTAQIAYSRTREEPGH